MHKITVRLDDDELAALEAMAYNSCRTRNTQAANLIVERLRWHKYLGDGVGRGREHWVVGPAHQKSRQKK